MANFKRHRGKLQRLTRRCACKWWRAEGNSFKKWKPSEQRKLQGER